MYCSISFITPLREGLSRSSLRQYTPTTPNSLQGRAQQALDDYTRAVQLAPEAPVPYLNRAIALEELGLQLVREGRPEEAGTR